MSVLSLDSAPEAFISNASIRREVHRAVTQGKLRKLATRLYTRNLIDTPETIIRRNLWPIVGGYFPGALIADRTAIENRPADDGSICLIADTSRTIALPGLVLRPRSGAGPLPDDRSFIAGLYLSSPARAMLENIRPSRGRDGLVSRTLGRKAIEERLELLIRRSGEDEINRLRDQIKAIAPFLGLEDEARALDAMIGALLGTRETTLETPAGKARQAGLPYDPKRLELFLALHRALRDWPPATRPARLYTDQQRATFAFYESYFSNFIEGTEFEVEEAAEIVFHGVMPVTRLADAHDILGTYRMAADPIAANHTAGSANELGQLLKACHAVIMGGRPDLNPGHFKSKGNLAGATVFVAPELVAGTLNQGYAVLQSLEAPFPRAAFMMFLVAEVHPFADGNGRTCRLMMNAELSAAGEQRIIIPTVFRNNYLAALNALSHSATPEPLIRVLDFAWRWTAAIDWQDVEATRRELEACHAFVKPGVADEQGIRLKMPGDLVSFKGAQ